MLAAYLASCLGLAIAFYGLEVWPRTRAMSAQFGSAARILRDASLSDLEKERAIRRISLQTLAVTAKLTLILAACFIAAALPVYAAKEAGWLTYRGFIDFSIHPLVIALTLVGLALIHPLAARLKS